MLKNSSHNLGKFYTQDGKTLLTLLIVKMNNTELKHNQSNIFFHLVIHVCSLNKFIYQFENKSTNIWRRPKDLLLATKIWEWLVKFKVGSHLATLYKSLLWALTVLIPYLCQLVSGTLRQQNVCLWYVPYKNGNSPLIAKSKTKRVRILPWLP